MNNNIINFWDIDSYIRYVYQIPPLSKSEENYLIEKKNAGDENAYNRLVEANLKLVIPIAEKYANYGLSLEDLIQDLNIKLLSCIRLFQHGNLQNYISIYLMWEIVRVASKYNIVQTSCEITNDLMKISAKCNNYFKENGIDPADNELSDLLDIDEEKISFLKKISNDNIISIEYLKELEEQGNEKNFVYDDYDINDNIYNFEISTVIRSIIEQLPDRLKMVIKYYHGFEDGHCYTQREIADIYGCTIARISQLYLKGLRIIKIRLEARNNRDFTNLYLSPRYRSKCAVKHKK